MLRYSNYRPSVCNRGFHLAGACGLLECHNADALYSDLGEPIEVMCSSNTALAPWPISERLKNHSCPSVWEHDSLFNYNLQCTLGEQALRLTSAGVELSNMLKHELNVKQSFISPPWALLQIPRCWTSSTPLPKIRVALCPMHATMSTILILLLL